MKVKKIYPYAKLPTRADSGSNGYDLYAAEAVFIPVGESRVVATGISIELSPPQENKMQVFKIEDRSSMAAKGLRTGGGVVDNSYRGHIKVIIHNLNYDTDKLGFSAGHSVVVGQGSIGGGNISTPSRGYQILIGDKIAQGLIYETVIEPIEEVEEVGSTDRNDKGFGSSGK